MDEFVRHYYGEVLEHSGDLKTDACCTSERPPAHVAALLGNIHEEVGRRYYGCGLVLPELLEGCRVLDLGCGAGRDCYLLAQIVGEGGEVVGVDMTEAQLDVAERYRAHHARRFGHASSNVRFLLGHIECLDELPLDPESFDVVVSNCAVNLAADKAAVLRGASRLLKPGGELHFADVYADRRVPAEARNDPVLYGECLGGALYWNDFIGLARQAGFPAPCLVTDRPIEITDAGMRRAVQGVQFFSATYRLFKLPDLEPAGEDYGQTAAYRGTVPNHESVFVLDKHHAFPTGEAVRVCGNTFDMLAQTRFREHFERVGDKSTHYGIFAGAGLEMPFSTNEARARNSGCC